MVIVILILTRSRSCSFQGPTANPPSTQRCPCTHGPVQFPVTVTPLSYTFAWSGARARLSDYCTSDEVWMDGCSVRDICWWCICGRYRTLYLVHCALCIVCGVGLSIAQSLLPIVFLLSLRTKKRTSSSSSSSFLFFPPPPRRDITNLS